MSPADETETAPRFGLVEEETVALHCGLEGAGVGEGVGLGAGAGAGAAGVGLGAGFGITVRLPPQPEFKKTRERRNAT